MKHRLQSIEHRTRNTEEEGAKETDVGLVWERRQVSPGGCRLSACSGRTVWRGAPACLPLVQLPLIQLIPVVGTVLPRCIVLYLSAPLGSKAAQYGGSTDTVEEMGRRGKERECVYVCVSVSVCVHMRECTYCTLVGT